MSTNLTTTAVSSSTLNRSNSALISSNSAGAISVQTSGGLYAFPPVGTPVTISGATPSYFNGTFNIVSVLTASQFTLSAPGITTGTASVAGTCTFPTQVISFAAQASAPTVGTYVTTAGILPSGYNGTVYIQSSTTTSVTIINPNGTTGSATQQGTITLNPTIYTVGAGGAALSKTTSANGNFGSNTLFGSIVAQGGAGGSSDSGSGVYMLGGLSYGAFSSVTSSSTGLTTPVALSSYLMNVSGGMGGIVKGQNPGGSGLGNYTLGNLMPNEVIASGVVQVVLFTPGAVGTYATGSNAVIGAGGDSAYGYGGNGSGGVLNAAVAGTGYGAGGGAVAVGGYGGGSALSGAGTGGLIIIEDFGSNG
jgi:hypothetical protein